MSADLAEVLSELIGSAKLTVGGNEFEYLCDIESDHGVQKVRVDIPASANTAIMGKLPFKRSKHAARLMPYSGWSMMVCDVVVLTGDEVLVRPARALHEKMHITDPNFVDELMKVIQKCAEETIAEMMF